MLGYLSPEGLSQLGAMLFGAAGIVTALGVLVHKTPLGKFSRWLWRKNVTEPAGDWLGMSVSATVRAELERTNGGSAFGDKIQEFSTGQAVIGDRLTGVETQLSDGTKRFERIETYIGVSPTEKDTSE